MARRIAPLFALLLSALALVIPVAASAAPGEVTDYALPYESEPEGIAAGPGGDLWFAEHGTGKIGRISQAGGLTEYPLQNPTSKPSQVTAGPDGNLWFTAEAEGLGNVGRITPAGAVTEWQVCGYCRPSGITTGPEGDIWFTLPGSGEVGRITPGGTITHFPLAALGPNEPRKIALGSDGNLWFADEGLVKEEPTIGQIGRITPEGAVTGFGVPVEVENFRPTAIAAGPDGALWFAGSGVGVGRIDTAGAVTEFPLPLAGEVDAMVAGPDGNIWFPTTGPGSADGSIDRLTPDGHLTTYSVPYGSRGIAVGPEGDIWFTELVSHAIGRIAPGAPGIEVTSTRIGGLHRHLSLFCNGGALGTRCEGELILRMRTYVRGRDGSRHRRFVPLAKSRYGLANETGGQVAIQIRSQLLRTFPEMTPIRVEALVRGSRGVGTHRALTLTLPNTPR
jgi:streptogramin lyase